MATTMQQPTRNGTPSAPAGLRIAGRKRRRPTWVAVGVMIVCGSGLAMALWASSLSDRVSVLAAAREVPAGQRIEAADLRVVDVAADSGLAILPAGRRDEVVGQLAVLTIPRGALVQRAQIQGGSAIPEGSAVVGVALKPGAVPVGDLRVGDRVSVVRVAQNAAEELGEATVFAVRPDTATNSGTVVSLLVAQRRATAVAQAAGLDQVRLVLLEQRRAPS